MEKKYISPEIKIAKFESEDILTTSGIITIADQPKSFTNADQLDTQDFSIFD